MAPVHGLPPGLALRAPRDEDAEDVAALWNAETMAALGLEDSTAAELRALWSMPDDVGGPRSAIVVDDRRRIVGYLHVEVDPTACEVSGAACLPPVPAPGLADALVVELERRAAWWHRQPGAAGVLRVASLDAPGAWPDALSRHGYVPTRRLLLMRRELDGELSPPRWPDGVSMRPFDRAADAAAVHAALTEAFADHHGPPYDPYDRWHRRWFVDQQLPIRDDLVVVAWAGDEVAGALLAAAETPETPQGGYVAEVGVRRAHRGRGLAHALLLEAFARLRALGRREALLHVDAASRTNATAVYRRAGMREQRMYTSWQRPPGSPRADGAPVT